MNRAKKVEEYKSVGGKKRKKMHIVNERKKIVYKNK